MLVNINLTRRNVNAHVAVIVNTRRRSIIVGEHIVSVRDSLDHGGQAQEPQGVHAQRDRVRAPSSESQTLERQVLVIGTKPRSLSLRSLSDGTYAHGTVKGLFFVEDLSELRTIVLPPARTCCSTRWTSSSSPTTHGRAGAEELGDGAVPFQDPGHAAHLPGGLGGRGRHRLVVIVFS